MSARFLLCVDLDTNQEVCAVPKGGWETSDKTLEAAAAREAYEEGAHPRRRRRVVLALYSHSTSYSLLPLPLAAVFAL